MNIYRFAKIATRSFPTLNELKNLWIFQDDVALVINVSRHYDINIAEAIIAKGITYMHFPLEEEVYDIGWENIKRAVAIILQYNKQDKRIIVHCEYGNHRSPLVVEAFYFAKFGEHFIDEYKGYENHLIYNCKSNHLPKLNIVEEELRKLNI